MHSITSLVDYTPVYAQYSHGNDDVVACIYPAKIAVDPLTVDPLTVALARYAFSQKLLRYTRLRACTILLANETLP